MKLLREKKLMLKKRKLIAVKQVLLETIKAGRGKHKPVKKQALDVCKVERRERKYG